MFLSADLANQPACLRRGSASRARPATAAPRARPRPWGDSTLARWPRTTIAAVSARPPRPVAPPDRGQLQLGSRHPRPRLDEGEARLRRGDAEADRPHHAKRTRGCGARRRGRRWRTGSRADGPRAPDPAPLTRADGAAAPRRCPRSRQAVAKAREASPIVRPEGQLADDQTMAPTVSFATRLLLDSPNLGSTG
jgi:hypothetical protein